MPIKYSVDRKLAVAIAILLLPELFYSTSAIAQTPPSIDSKTTISAEKDIRLSEIGKPIEKQLSGTKSDNYQIELQVGQFLRVIVEQKGIDLELLLFDPDGKQLVASDSPNGTYGIEPVSIIAGKAGRFRLVVRSLNKDAPLGKYTVKIEELRSPKDSDKSLIAAERVFMQGEQLRQAQTLQSKQQALAKYLEALPIFKALGKLYWQSLTLTTIGAVYSDLGEKQKALEFYNQSLPLSLTVGDSPNGDSFASRSQEARTLNNIGVVYSDLGEKQKALEYLNQSLSLRRALGDRSGEANTLNNIGRVYSDLGEKQKALEYLNQSLPLIRAMGNPRGEAQTLNNIGSIYDDLGKKQKALEFFNQSLLLSRAVGDRLGEARILNNIGVVYDDLGEKPKALEFFNQSLPLSRTVGDRSQEAFTLNNIGRVYDALGEKQKALEFYNRSLPLLRAVGDPRGEATILNNIGKVYDALGEKPKALEFFNQSLPLSRATGDRSQEAITLNNIGSVYDALGEKPKALEFFNQSLPLSRTVADRSQEALTLNNIGAVYDTLGEKQKALEFYNQSLPLSRAIGDPRGEATILNNIGKVYDALGEKQKALEFFNQSLPLSRATGDRSHEALTLNNIGKVYFDLGEKQKALEFYNQSLPLIRAVGEPRGEAIILNNIGAAYFDLGEKQKALEFYNQSLPLSRATGDRLGEARTFNNIGMIYDALGEKQKALEFYNQSLPLSRAIGDREIEARTINNIGKVYFDLGEKQKALEFYNQSLPLSRAVGDREIEAITLYNLAYLERNRGNLKGALTQIEAAVTIIDSLRTKITSQQLRSSYFATVQDRYKFYIDLLMQLHKTNPSQGYDSKALTASERSRARSLLETLTEARADIRTGVDPKLLEQERSLQQKLSSAEENRVKIISGNYTDAQKKAIETEIQTLLNQYQEVATQIRLKSPRYAALTQPQPLTLQEIQQQVLDDNTVLLEYSLGEERSYLWAVTKTGITTYELPKNADIELLVKRFQQEELVPPVSIRRNRDRGAKASDALSKILLQPVASLIAQKRLLIVSDGALQYIPFAALPVPQVDKNAETRPTPLIVEHEIISLPSASTLAVLRRELTGRKPAPKTIAILADPVFSVNDDRVKKSGQGPRIASSQKPTASSELDIQSAALSRAALESDVNLNRLKFTRTEAQEIMALVPAQNGKQSLDFIADRAAATSADLAQYKIVHFATHGIMNSAHPELSGIVLSLFDENGKPQNGFLRLHDIYNLNLPVELVVLSACNTGLGKDIKGEGLVGLTRGFMYAGASRVVVSLWNVNDLATSELMKRFYQKMLSDKLTPAAALRAAQIEMLNTQWKLPYYWAAFVIQGEWN